MATLALFALSSAGGPAAGLTAGQLFAAGLAASFIDQRFIFPLLFPQKTEAARLGSFEFPSADEGQPMYECFGNEAKVPGQLIWASNMIEEEDASSGGGKGGTGGDFVQYKYYMHLAIGVASHPCPLLRKIWADGKVIYNLSPDFNETFDSWCELKTVGPFGGPGGPFYSHRLRIYAAANGPDLMKIQTGQVVTVSGWTDIDNNGIFLVTGKQNFVTGISRIEVEIARITSSTHPGSAEGTAGGGAANPDVTLFQSQPRWSAKQMAEEPIFHIGTPGQLPDPLIESLEGTGNVPAWRGRCYVVIRKLSLFDYGNRPPNFHVMVQGGALSDETLASVFTRILSAKLSPTEFDVNDLDSIVVKGYTVRGPQPIAQKLVPLMLAHDVLVRQEGSKLVFFQRVNAPVIVINPTDLAVNAYGEDSAPRNIEVRDERPLQLPRMMVVEYQDANKNYETGTQNFRRNNILSNVIETVNLQMVLSDDEAAKVADRLLWQAWNNHERVRFTLPLKYVNQVLESTVLTFAVHNRSWRIITDDVSRGDNHVLEVTGRVDDLISATSLAAGTGSSGGGGLGSQHADWGAGYLELMLLDLPPLLDEHATQTGFYFAVGFPEPGKHFSGGYLYESTNSTDNVDEEPETQTWKLLSRIDDQAHFGHVLQAPSAGVTPNAFDNVSVVRVELFHGTLASCTELELLNGENTAVIGSEVIGFQNAVLVDTNTYELTKLLRGLRSTDGAIAGHVVGEQFVLLNKPGVQWQPVRLSSLSSTRQYKAVPAGGILELSPALTFAPEGKSVKPWAPTHVKGTRDALNSLTVTWVPRARRITRVLAPQALPLDESREGYDVEFYDTQETPVLLRSATLWNATTKSYADFEQISDGITPGDPITVRVYQRSDVHRRGDYVEVVL